MIGLNGPDGGERAAVVRLADDQALRKTRVTQIPKDAAWPELPLAAWQDAYATLRLWTQIIGKVRFELTPFLNHSWSVTLYVTGRGFGPGPIPLDARDLSIDFDFPDPVLWLRP